MLLMILTVIKDDPSLYVLCKRTKERLRPFTSKRVSSNMSGG